MSRQPQPSMLPVSMSVSSTTATSTPNIMINNPRAQNVTTLKIDGAQQQQPTIIPNVQSVGTRAVAPGIALQTLHSLRPVQQGHVLVKSENGQYHLLRMGTTPPAPIACPVAAAAPPAALPLQQLVKPAVNTTEKCRNFLANILDLSCNEPKSVEKSVRNLIQELIDSQVEPEQFCNRLERLLNASPQPYLIGFLKKTLPLLQQSLITKELVIEGINPPSAQVAYSSTPMWVPSSANYPKSRKAAIAVLQTTPVQTMINIGEMSNPKRKSNYSRAGHSTPLLSTFLTPGKIKEKALLKEEEKNAVKQYTAQLFGDDKMAGDDDINDVTAMGGVNLAEESHTILGSTELIGTQIRSCKDKYLLPMRSMQARIKAVCANHKLDEPFVEVTGLINHAVHERIKNIVEKLAVVAQHRIDIIKTESRYEITQDVKGQIKFLEELDRADKKQRDDVERELLLRAAKSRSKKEDPEQSKLKAKAKEMQRAELEELRQREANLTALQAIGPRKKARLDGPGGTGDSSASNVTGLMGQSQMTLRATRLKRINQRDMLFLLEQEKETAHSILLYRSYLNLK